MLSQSQVAFPRARERDLSMYAHRTTMLLGLAAWVILAGPPSGRGATAPSLDEVKENQAIDDLETQGAKAVPGLVDLLGSKDEYIRLRAAIALGKAGKASVEPLVKLLASDDADMRFYAVWALAFAGP